MTRLIAVALALAGLTTQAQAADVYMWGVGPRLGTNFLPGAYPAAFPQRVQDDGLIEKVRTDVVFGFEGQFYLDGGSRIGMIGGFDVGRRYFDAHVLGKYNAVVKASTVDFLVGGGAGFGTQRWGGEDEASLRVPYFPVRAEAAGMFRADWTAFQLTLYAQYNIQGNHFYSDRDGTEVDVSGGFYPAIGLEMSVLFGDYEPPSPRKR